MSQKVTHSKRMKGALDKFDPKEAEKVLDLLFNDEEKGYQITKEENDLRERLWKCLEAYERTMYYLEN